MSKTNSGLVAYAKAQVGLPYWYGTFGQKASASLHKQKKAQYPKYYTATDFPKQYGKRVHDCVGMIKGYIWSDSATGTPKYNASQDKSASGMYAAAKIKGTISSFPATVGLLVFKGSTASKITHVGIYDGAGTVYEAKGHEYGVVKTVFKASQWQFWAQCPYTVADAKTDEKIRPGDKVKVLNAITYTGGRFKTYYKEYDVLEIKGDRVVIGIGKVVTAAVKASNLQKV